MVREELWQQFIGQPYTLAHARERRQEQLAYMQTQHDRMMEMLREANQLADQLTESRRYSEFRSKIYEVYGYTKMLMEAQGTLSMIDMIISNTEG
jgi:hypothetical protein